MSDQEEKTVIKLIAWSSQPGTPIPEGSTRFLIFSDPHY
jgi:hypothetical protein